MLTVDQVNSKSSGATIFGWFAGLAWVAFTGGVTGLSWLDWTLLIVVGMFGASIVIGAGFAMLAAGLTKAATGRSDGSPHLYLPSDCFLLCRFSGPTSGLKEECHVGERSRGDHGGNVGTNLMSIAVSHFSAFFAAAWVQRAGSGKKVWRVAVQEEATGHSGSPSVREGKRAYSTELGFKYDRYFATPS